MGKYQFKRREPFKFTKKLFLIASEGAETEPIYFDELKLKVNRNSVIRLKLVSNPGHKSHPTEVLKRLREAAKEEGIRSGDELWLLIDRDDWSEDDLDAVCREAKKTGFFVALSNPCFELWLYLHLKNYSHFTDRHHCQREFGKVCKSYSENGKGGYNPKGLIGKVSEAIKRAKGLDRHPSQPWPKTHATRVYLLVEKILKHVQ